MIGFFRSLFGRKRVPKQSSQIWTPPAANPPRPPVWQAPKRAAAEAAAAHDAPAAAPEEAAVEPSPAEPIAPVEIAAPPDRSATPWEIRTLLQAFETLGASPEFGLVRQKLRAPPDGLFGFASLYPRVLILLLQQRFAGLGEADTLTTKAAWGSYYATDTRYGVTWRTDLLVDQTEEADVPAQEAARLHALRGQLVENLTAGSRLFVYCGAATDEEVAAIRAAMGGYGENTLLHLVEADASNPARKVEWRQPGLLRGYLSRYGSKGGPWDIALEDWVSICRTAYSLWRAPSGP